MGDGFSDSSSQQSAQNQQIGVSTRDTGGSVITIGAGAASNGGTVKIESLDPQALSVAANAIHQAIESNTATSLKQTEAYQRALTISAETAQQAITKAGNNETQTGIDPKLLIFGAVALVAVVVVFPLMLRK